MASVTKGDEKSMATEAISPGADEPDRGPGPQRADREQAHGFFTIYKKGQGYWTRIFTAVGAAVLIGVTAQFIYTRVPYYIKAADGHRNLLLAIVAAIVVVAMLMVWKAMNSPGNADFLIATDSEMKKVNWTSRQELIGSTKVVILFMFMIAALLFVLDLYFTRMFYLIGVLLTDAPLWRWVENRAGLGAKVALDIVSSVIVIGGTVWAVMSASKKS